MKRKNVQLLPSRPARPATTVTSSLASTGFRDVSVVARKNRAHSILDACISRQSNRWNASLCTHLLLSHLSNQSVTIHAGHCDIADQQIKL
jgi:hypothetical protein